MTWICRGCLAFCHDASQLVFKWRKPCSNMFLHGCVFLFSRCLWWTVRWALLFVLRWARHPWPATLPESSSLITWCSKSPSSPRGPHASRTTQCSKRWGMVFYLYEHWDAEKWIWGKSLLVEDWLKEQFNILLPVRRQDLYHSYICSIYMKL